MKNWTYSEGTTPHFQGQISCEETGETIAVTYSDESGEKARLIAAAPDLAAKLADLIQYLAEDWNGDQMVEECKEALADAGCPFEYEQNENATQP